MTLNRRHVPNWKQYMHERMCVRVCVCVLVCMYVCVEAFENKTTVGTDLETNVVSTKTRRILFSCMYFQDNGRP